MRTTSSRTFIKRIIGLGFGIFFLFFAKDIGLRIVGGVFLIWAIVNLLGDKYYTFEVISDIFDMIFGLSFMVFYIIIAISASDWTPLLVSVLGLLIFLQGLLPIIDKIKRKKNTF